MVEQKVLFSSLKTPAVLVDMGCPISSRYTTSSGKAVSGGVSAGAVVGRADIIDMLKPKAPSQPFLLHFGTWNANPLVSAAGVATCKLYLDGEPQKKANQMGAYLREKGNQALKERGISGRL